jgi:hypothetical protein
LHGRQGGVALGKVHGFEHGLPRNGEFQTTAREIV